MADNGARLTQAAIVALLDEFASLLASQSGARVTVDFHQNDVLRCTIRAEHTMVAVKPFAVTPLAIEYAADLGVLIAALIKPFGERVRLGVEAATLAWHDAIEDTA